MLMGGFPSGDVINEDGQVIKTKENGGKIQSPLVFTRCSDWPARYQLSHPHTCLCIANYLKD